MTPTFFENPASFRAWIEANHDSEDVFWVGLHKKGSGLASITWPELVDEVLCFGWIDGLKKSVDEHSYMIRITPRRRRSNWSDVNIRRIAELIEQGLVRPAGLAEFRRWEESEWDRAGKGKSVASGGGELDEGLGDEFERRFRTHPAAWEFFQSQPPGYRRTVTEWVVGAKRDATRLRRLETLIEDSAAGLRIKQLRKEQSGG